MATVWAAVSSSSSSPSLTPHPTPPHHLRLPPQRQSFYFKSMLSKHRHDGAWTLLDYRLPKRLLTAHIATNYTISYTQLSLGCRLWEECKMHLVLLHTLRCLFVFWLMYCTFGSIPPRICCIESQKSYIYVYMYKYKRVFPLAMLVCI